MLLFFVVISYPSIYENQFITKDCYRSFSNHEEYFELFHYYPTGPPHLFLKLELKLYSYIFGFTYKKTVVHYHLKRINNSCNNSLIFSTLGNSFRKMYVSIEMLQKDYRYPMGDIQYIFHPGLDHDHYKLVDKNTNFGLVVKIIDVNNELFIALNSSFSDAQSYIESLSWENAEICVITENNRGVVLKPNNNSIIIQGLITKVTSCFTLNRKAFYQNTYPAFGCYKNNDYPNETIVFIFDQVKYDLIFFLDYWKIVDGYSREGSIIFKISNEKFVNFDNMYHLPHNYKKLFLLKTVRNSRKLPNGIEIEKLITREETIYLSKELREIEVSRGVKMKLWIYDSILNSIEYEN